MGADMGRDISLYQRQKFLTRMRGEEKIKIRLRNKDKTENFK
jgi:hypothetical protein